MRFYIRKRRSTPTVIIVALIDVLIVLLIFLMVTTTFKQQQSLRLNLPDSTQAKKEGASEDDNLFVNINADGIYSVDQVKTPLTLEQLEAEIQSRVSKDPNLFLVVNADDKAPWGRLVKVQNIAGLVNIKPGHLKATGKQAAPQ